MSDPYYSSVVLQLSFNGANSGTTFTDDSPLATVPTVTGSAVTSTTSPKYGTASGFFPGAGDRLTFTNAGLALGTGDLTIEFWINLAATSATQLGILGNSTGSNSLAIGKSGTNTIIGVMGSVVLSSTSAMVAGTWMHVAFTRSGSTNKIWINGALQDTQTDSTNFTLPTTWFVGAWDTTAASFNGYIDDLRVTKDVARYTAAFTPPDAFAAVTGGVANLICPMGTLLAQGGAACQLVCPMGQLTASGGPSANSASAGLTAPMGALFAYGGGQATLTAPMGTLSAYGGGLGQFTAPMGTLSAAGHESSGEYAFAGAAPMGTLLAYGGASARIAAPMGTLSAAGTVTALGSATLTAPRPQLGATGTIGQVGNFSEFLAPPMGTLVGYGGTLCSITGPMGTLQATGTVGGVGYATLVAPLFELTASGTAQNHGGADLLAPAGRLGATGQAWLIAPMAALTAIGTAVVAVSYEAYSVNLTRALDRNPSNQYDAQVDEVSRYTNFPFTAIVRYRNSYFGVAADGLYLLEGTTDAGTPIPYNVKTCKSDFGVPEQKTVSSAYFGGHLGAAETITLFVGDQAPQAQSYTTPRGIRAQNHRQKFGKGNKTRYYALGVSGSAELELDTIDFEVDTMKRRI